MFSHTCQKLLISTALIAGALIAPLLEAADFPGGFVEQPGTALARPNYSKSQLLNLLPSRGKFSFPAPYNTSAVRLTNESDCNNLDCVNHVGYSYWSNTNNHVGQNTMLIFVVLDRHLGGAGPTLLQYNKVTDQVTNLGTLFDNANPLSWATGEGWYFSATLPNALYVNSGSTLFRYDVLTRTATTVFDLKDKLGSGYYLWQLHSSADDRVHSATVRQESTSAMLGCMAYRESTREYLFFPKKGDYDECQIDKSGKWLLIKENIDGINGEDNRIINLETLQERDLLDQDGAAGHSDMGYGYMIAADNFAPLANAWRMWKFDASTLSGTTVYHNSDWNIFAPSHVSHGNAQSGVAPEHQYACGGSANRSSTAEANEIICFNLDGADKALVVAPVMTDMNANGGGTEYGKTPKGNLDVTGQYFIWTSNMGGDRLDYFLVKVPAQLLASGGSATTTSSFTASAPSVDVTPPVLGSISADAVGSNSARITWTTNELANDMVQYGVTSAYSNSTSINTALALVHSQTLSNLNPGTVYHYKAFARDAAGNIAGSTDMTFTTLSPSPQLADVQWSNVVNAAAYGNTLVKTGSCDGCADAGGNSAQAIRTGNGYVEITITDKNKMIYAGLSTAIDGTTADRINFALRVQAGYVEVRENGTYRADTTIANGDVLRVSVQNGKVNYARNGIVLYTSALAPTWPLRLYATLFSGGSSVNSARIMGTLQ
jgi:hypothetical protein